MTKIGRRNSEAISVDSMIGDNDDQRVLRALEMAETIAPLGSGRNATLVFAERRYDFDDPIDFGGRCVTSVGNGKRSTQFRFLNAQDGQSLVTLKNSFGQTIENIWVTANNAEGLIAFDVQSVSSFKMRDCNFRLQGLNTIGLKVSTNGTQNTESASFTEFGGFAAMPLVHNSGDNCTYWDFDLSCGGDPNNPELPGTTGDNVWAGIQGKYELAHITFRGSIQRGHHAVHFDSEFVTGTRSPGQGARFVDIRYEQGVIDPAKPEAWRLIFNRTDTNGDTVGHGQERILFVNCRHSLRAVSTNVFGTLGYETYGSFLSGDIVAGSQAAD